MKGHSDTRLTRGFFYTVYPLQRFEMTGKKYIIHKYSLIQIPFISMSYPLYVFDVSNEKFQDG